MSADASSDELALWTEATTWHHHSGLSPIATTVHTSETGTLGRQLRTIAAAHDDTAWISVRVLTDRDGLAPLSKDLRDASAVVGLSAPRAVGDRHLIGAMTGWLHGPVRHVILTGVEGLKTDVLFDLHEAAIITGVQLWLVLDAGSTKNNHVAWAASHTELVDQNEFLARWAARPVFVATCAAPERQWWITPGTWPADLPAGHTCERHGHRTGCLLASARQHMTTGKLAAGNIREKLIELGEDSTTTTVDHWHLRDASRNGYSEAEDILYRLPLAPAKVMLGDVAIDGSRILVGDTCVDVPVEQQAPLARMRTSRLLAGCLQHETLLGLYDDVAGYDGTRSVRRR